MIRCVAFLRGINVGGHRLISMQNLKEIFEVFEGGLLKNVTTYIQSGNVIFDIPPSSFDGLEKNLEHHLLQSLGYEVPVMIRSIAQISAIIEQNPFSNHLTDKDAKLYLIFLKKEPDPAASQTLIAKNHEYETFYIREREIYCLVYKNPAEKRRYVMDSLEKIIKIPGTNRNWATVNKILTL